MLFRGRVNTDGHDLSLYCESALATRDPRILECKFKGGLTESEKHSDLRPGDPHFFFSRVATLTGITFTSTAGHKHDLEFWRIKGGREERRRRGRHV